MKLYELTDKFLTVSQMIDNGEYDSQVLLDTLDSIECAIEVKAQNYIYIDRNLQGYSNSLDAEIKRLEFKKHIIDNQLETLRNNLFRQLELVKLTEVKTDIATIKQVNNPPSVLIVDEKKIPAKFQTIIPKSYKVNKAEIAKELKAGKKVKGAILQTSKRWQIK